MAKGLIFNGYPFSVFGELEKDAYLSEEGEKKGRGGFIPIEEVPSDNPSPLEVLLEKEEKILF